MVSKDHKDLFSERDLVRAVFRQQHGQELLDLWRKQYVDGPVYRPGNEMEDVAYREGKRQLVISIEDMMNE